MDPTTSTSADDVNFQNSALRKLFQPFVENPLLAILRVLASLKITIVLFLLSLILVYVGTLAQARADIWEVVRDYFRSWGHRVPVKVLFPPAWFSGWDEVKLTFPMLGGKSIGAMMAVNLLAAHTVRFQKQAKGMKLLAGLGVILAGVAVTGAVIANGNGTALPGESALGPSTRILWQLTQATFAGLVLLAGCQMVFGKRAGIVLLHGGIGLMMFAELWVSLQAVETQMHLVEGETVNFLQDIRTVELALIDDSDEKNESVVAIPQRLLQEGKTIQHAALPVDLKVVKYLQNSDLKPASSAGKFENPVKTGFGRDLIAEEAKAGVGTSAMGKVDESAAYIEVLKKGTSASLGTFLTTLVQSRFVEACQRTGLSESELQSRFRVGPFVQKLCQPTEFEVDGKKYRLALRFKRSYEPYAMTLKNVRSDKYIGTSTVKNYSSTVQLVDPTRKVDTEVTIWMNNPLRFAGQTFYQSTVGEDPITHLESTGLQVVTNSGWMIPYVSCMIVAVGMAYQFGLTLLRFLGRRERANRVVEPVSRAGAQRLATTPALSAAPGFVRTRAEWAVTGGLIAMYIGLVAYFAKPAAETNLEFDLRLAGTIPVVADGRVKPLDSLARHSLQAVSNSQLLKIPADGYAATEKEENPKTKTAPAMKWMLDLISGSDFTWRHRVFRIDHPQVLELFGLERRKLHLYSVAEIRGKADSERLEKFYKEVTAARQKPVESLDANERKLIELDRRIRAFTAITAAFVDPEFHRPKFPTPDAEMREMAKNRKAALLRSLQQDEEHRLEGHPPLAVPVHVDSDGGTKLEWKPYMTAYLRDAIEADLLETRKPEPLVAAWNEILAAYAENKPAEFNVAVKKYLNLVEEAAPPDLNMTKTRFEAFFNRFSPFDQAWGFYIVAFVLSALAWIGWTSPLNRAIFALNLLVFGLHTFAIIARIYISGRPPITNLYATAPFIGWACVVGGLIVERLYRNGIGNVVASISGSATLLIASKLAESGDTFAVMQAVLDTQFWLATHVVCINLGYAPTFFAGILGVIYILRGTFTWTLTPEISKDLGRMIYGTLCFATFFSFFGTVLGGLWADDSWGRFWGWDPKENGALMIVIWNALVMHARWDGLVKDRGTAVLAVIGNIITAWSWFGVNELGVGLHSYGFTEGVLRYLSWFIFSQSLIIVLGCLPKAIWLSHIQVRQSKSATAG